MNINSSKVEELKDVYVAVLRNRLLDIIQQEKHHLSEEEYERIKKYQKKVVRTFCISLELSALIAETYNIQEIGEEPLEVWRNKIGDKFEYINQKGVWKASYLNSNYCEVECSVKGIFNLLNSELLVAEKLVDEVEMENHLPKAKLAKYFHNFIDNTRKIASGQKLTR